MNIFTMKFFKSYLAERNIEVKYVDKISQVENSTREVIKEVVKEKTYKYTTVFGAKLDEKPEHMTQLKGNLLVFKDDKRKFCDSVNLAKIL